MEIRPTSAAQVAQGRDGRTYEVSGEAGRIAQRLHELDPSLRVTFNEGGMFFVVSQLVDAERRATSVASDTTTEKLVRRVPQDQWDGRVIREFEARAYEIRNGISAAGRLDALDAKKDAATMERLDAEVREKAYPLFRKMQRELFSSNPRAFIASGLSR